jgi:hypothetical protein
VLSIIKLTSEGGLLEANRIQASNHAAGQRNGHDGPVTPRAWVQWKSADDDCGRWIPRSPSGALKVIGKTESRDAFQHNAVHENHLVKRRISPLNRIPAARRDIARGRSK